MSEVALALPSPGAEEAEDGASLVSVGVGAPAGLKPDGGVVSGKSGETWDYVSEII